MKSTFRSAMITGLALATSTFGGAQTMTLLSADYGVEGDRIDVTCRVQSMVQNGYLRFRVTNYALGGDPAPDQAKELRTRMRDPRGRVRDVNFLEKEDVTLQITDRGPTCPDGAGLVTWQGRLNGEDQQRFDSYYKRWLHSRHEHDQEAVGDMENRMYDVYDRYGIAGNVPFSQVASPNVAWEDNSGYRGLQVIQASYGVPGRTIDVTDRLRGMISNGTLSLKVDNDSMGGDPAHEKHKALSLQYSYRGQQRTVTVNEHSDLNLP